MHNRRINSNLDYPCMGPALRFFDDLIKFAAAFR